MSETSDKPVKQKDNSVESSPAKESKEKVSRNVEFFVVFSCLSEIWVIGEILD